MKNKHAKLNLPESISSVLKDITTLPGPAKQKAQIIESLIIDAAKNKTPNYLISAVSLLVVLNDMPSSPKSAWINIVDCLAKENLLPFVMILLASNPDLKGLSAQLSTKINPNSEDIINIDPHHSCITAMTQQILSAAPLFPSIMVEAKIKIEKALMNENLSLATTSPTNSLALSGLIKI